MDLIKNFLLNFFEKYEKFLDIRNFLLHNQQQTKQIIDTLSKNYSDIKKIENNYFYLDYQKYSKKMISFFLEFQNQIEKYILKIDRILKDLSNIHNIVKKCYTDFKISSSSINNSKIGTLYKNVYENLKKRVSKEKQHKKILEKSLLTKDVQVVVKTFFLIFGNIFQKKIEKLQTKIQKIFPDFDNFLLKEQVSLSWKNSKLNIQNSTNLDQIQIENFLLSKQEEEIQKEFLFSQNLLSEENSDIMNITQNLKQNLTPKTIIQNTPFKLQKQVSKILKTKLEISQSESKFKMPQKENSIFQEESNLFNQRSPSPTFQIKKVQISQKENFVQNNAKTTTQRNSNTKKFQPQLRKIKRNKSQVIMSNNKPLHFYYNGAN